MGVIALLAALVLAGTAATDRATDRPAACEPLIQTAQWHAATLSVDPSRCGRRIAVAQPRKVLDAAVAIAGGEATETLLDQLRCHAYFASFKAEWNLEADRPAVSWPEMIATACNPPR